MNRILLAPIAFLLAASTLAEAQRMPLTTTSDAARSQYVAGLDALTNVDFTRAVAHLDAAIAADPSFALAHMYRAAASANGRDAHMGHATARAPNASESERQMIEAYAANLRDEHDREIALLNAVAARYPGDPLPWFVIANTEANRGDPAAAVLAARRALAADPTFAPAYNLMGYAEVARGDLAAAEKAFREYIRLAPDLANPYDSYGEFFLNQGRLDEAQAQYEMALSKDPRFDNARTMLSRIGIERSRRRFEQAVERGGADSIAALYTTNAVLLPPDSPPITGRAAIREYMAGQLAAGVSGVGLKTVEVVRLGDIAVERADITVRVKGKADEHGKSFVLWRLVGDTWMYDRDIWNMNAASTAR